jgi:hypothetical protein
MVKFIGAKIELVPWVHEVAFQAHRDTINYLGGLPKNTSIAMELTMSQFVLYGKLMDMLVGRKPSKTVGGRREKKEMEKFTRISTAYGSKPADPVRLASSLGDSHWAWLETLYTCGKINAKIVPIDSNPLAERAHFAHEYLGQAGLLGE